MFIQEKLKNLQRRYQELGFPKTLYFYLNNFFFGEQTHFNTASLVRYLLKKGLGCCLRKSKLSKYDFDTDKGSSYLYNYEKFFDKFRNKKISLLELGVYKGGSLLMWSKYFKKGNIVGVDINDVDIKLPVNVKMEKGDQRDKEFLETITNKYTERGFDIIIDDASHFGNFTEASFLICFKNLLKSGGIYVIEDWGTGYWEDWPDGKLFDLSEDHLINKLRRRYTQSEQYENPGRTSYKSHDFGMVGFIKQLIDELAIEDIKHSNKSVSFYTTDILSIFIAPGQVFIFKK